MRKATFLAVVFVIAVPVILGLATDSIGAAVFALVWAFAWWAFFAHTYVGRKLYRKGYRIACEIMGDCDV